MFEGLFQPMHLLVVLGIALLIVGPKKLPELGKGLGDGIRGFRASLHGDSAAGENASPAKEPLAKEAEVQPKVENAP